MNWLYRLLEIPFVYRLSQVLLAPGQYRFLEPIFKRIFNHPAQRVLDVGCGPHLNTTEPQGLLVGVDINPSYINQYTGGFVDEDPRLILAPPPSRRRLGYVASADQLPFADGSFDEVRTFGLFHHLTDEQTRKTLQEMNRCLGRGGRMVVLDNVWPLRAWTRPLAWLTRRLDRGKHVRTQEELHHMILEACPGSWTWERNTYTYTGLEHMCFQCVKN